MIVAGIGTWLGEPSTHDVIGVVGDHINLTGENPLIGRSDSEGSPRFVDMSVAYSERLIELAELSAAERGRVARRVILAECRPECAGGAEEARWANRLGAEAIGFGIAPFAIAATSQGIETLAFFGAADADWLRTSGRDRAAPGGPRPLAEIVLSCIRRIPVPLES
jgi:purine-nucleoside phosphorylase